MFIETNKPDLFSRLSKHLMTNCKYLKLSIYEGK